MKLMDEFMKLFAMLSSFACSAGGLVFFGAFQECGGFAALDSKGGGYTQSLGWLFLGLCILSRQLSVL